MTNEPGEVTGNAMQADEIQGNVVNHVENINNYYVAPPQPEQRLDPWLVAAGVIALAAGITVIITLFGTDEKLPPPVGVGLMLERRWFIGSDMRESTTITAIWFGIWLVWSGVDLVNRHTQARQRERQTAQVALWLSFIPIYVALEAPAVWLVVFALATMSSVMALVQGPQSLQPRWGAAVLAGAIAAVTWYAPELTVLWSERADPTPAVGLVGTWVMLAIIVIPVYAVLTEQARGAARVLRSWAFCLTAKLVVSGALLLIYPRDADEGASIVSLWLPACGVIAMLMLAGSVRAKVSAEGA
ncbi:hypothetical protein LFM09_12795 [Lentzea alba]|uniref:hypothetical protein n=1 Tax=Lentzea alba TaxID=2714351 RepID=UPI0039BF717B